jgi:hypothetical protein
MAFGFAATGEARGIIGSQESQELIGLRSGGRRSMIALRKTSALYETFRG